MIKAKAIPINTLHTAFSMNCIQLKLLTDDRFVICNIVMQCKREQSRCQMGRRATEVQGLKLNEGDGNQSPNWKDALLCWVRWERGGGATSRKQHHLDSHTLLIPPRTEDYCTNREERLRQRLIGTTQRQPARGDRRLSLFA